MALASLRRHVPGDDAPDRALTASADSVPRVPVLGYETFILVIAPPGA